MFLLIWQAKLTSLPQRLREGPILESIKMVSMEQKHFRRIPGEDYMYGFFIALLCIDTSQFSPDLLYADFGIF